MASSSHRVQRIVGCLAVGGLVLGLALAARIADPAPVAAIRALTFDFFQRLSPRPYQDAGVRIVDIDEASLTALGQWPWPRTRVAELVRRLSDLGAAAIALDILFPEADRTSPSRTLANLDLPSDEVRQRVKSILEVLPDHDEVLAQAIGDAPVVLGFATGPTPNTRRPVQKSGWATAGTSPVKYLQPFRGAIVSLPVLEEAARGQGSLDRAQERASGVSRRIPLISSDGERLYSGLSLEALRVAQGASTTIVRSSDASGENSGGAPAMIEAKVGQFAAPTTDEGDLVIYYDHNRRERYISAAALFDAKKAEEIRPLIDGHIVFVGSSAAGLLDAKVTALGELVPGVMIHAQAAEQILAGQFLSRPDWANGFELISTAAYSILVACLLTVVGARFVAPVIATVIGAIVVGAWVAFVRYGLLLDPIYTAATALAVYVAVSAVLYLTSDREKRFIRQAFGQYLAPEVLARLEARPELLALGGEIKVITILFMDVRGFTTISERLSAHEITAFMNALLSPLSDEIQKEQGTIDKYIGDSIMAFWNAPLDVPDHAARACRAALAMIAVVERMNKTDAFGLRGNHDLDLDVEIGVGLNTGEACVGNMGSEHRFNYSALGDTINAGARIESACKEAGWPLMISEQTKAAAPGFATLEVGPIPLKGKKEPLILHALVGDEAMAESAQFQVWADAHRALIEAIARQNSAAANAALLNCRAVAGPASDHFYDQFTGRIAAAETRPRDAVADPRYTQALAST